MCAYIVWLNNNNILRDSSVVAELYLTTVQSMRKRYATKLVYNRERDLTKYAIYRVAD